MKDVLKKWPLYLTVGIVLISLEQIGILSGWSSPVLLRLQSPNSTITISNDEGSWIASVLTISASSIAPVASMMMHYLGRKIPLLISVIIFTLYWVLVPFASTAMELIIARVIGGIGFGILNTIAYVYLAEISPDDIRGSIGIGPNICIHVGILWIYFFGSFPDLWISSLSSALPLVFVFICYIWLPESPYFLIEKGKEKEAKKELQKLRTSNDIDEDISKIKTTLGAKTTENMFKELFFNVEHMRALFITMGAFTLGQFTGGVTFLFYAHEIFKKAGNISPNTMTIIKATMQIIASIVAVFVIDKIGRKPLLIISCSGCAIFMFCEGIYFYLYQNNYNVESIWWLPLMAMVLFNVFQVVGLVPIPKFYLGELFHPKVKALAVCICEAYWGLLIAIVGKLFQIFSDKFGDFVPFFIFSAIGILGVLFIIFFIPETKGKSFDEIHYYMKYKCYEESTNTNNNKLEKQVKN